MKAMIRVDKAKHVYQDRGKWTAMVSAYPDGNRACSVRL